MRGRNGRLPFRIHYQNRDIVLLPSVSERIAELVRPEIDADWIAELVALTADPDKVRPASMPTLVQQLGRLTSWAQATQTEWLARFARPGVAMPIGDVLEAAMASDADLAIHSSYPVQPTEDDLYTERAYSQTSVYGDPVWDALVARNSAQFAAVEIGATLHLSPITARGMVEDAVEFVDELPATLDAWRHGRLDRSRARVIAERTAVLDAPSRKTVEDSILGSAKNDPALLTPGKLRNEVDRTVIATDPAAADKRAEKARASRKVQVTPLGDNMSRFSADVAAQTAALANEVLDVAAKAIPKNGRSGRTLDQLRADVFADIVDRLARNGFVDLRGSRAVGCDDNGGDRPSHDGDGGSDGYGYGSNDDVGSESNDGGSLGPAIWKPLGTSGSVTVGDGPESNDGGSLDPAIWKPLGTSVSVTVAASTLAGLDDEPAQLAGYGWITADLARALTESARTARALLIRDADADHQDHPPDTGSSAGGAPPAHGSTTSCNDVNCGDGDHANNRWCGTELDYGRSVYRPPAAVRDLVIQRDRVCRFIGCRRKAQRCDIDHRNAFSDNPSDPDRGVTCPCNLDCLCRFHHRIKTFTGWSAIRLPGNRMRWTSPLGATFVDEPDDVPIGTPTATSLPDRRSPYGATSSDAVPDDPPPF
jgi:hypothetical protein